MKKKSGYPEATVRESPVETSPGAQGSPRGNGQMLGALLIKMGPFVTPNPAPPSGSPATQGLLTLKGSHPGGRYSRVMAQEPPQGSQFQRGGEQQVERGLGPGTWRCSELLGLFLE